jgi:cysteine synthase A
MILNNITEFIGHTPIVYLKKESINCASVYLKLEEFNPGGSIKSRVANNMIMEAEKKGILVPHSGQTIIEPTGGNTGIGLAIVSAIRGYNVILVVPDNYSIEKIKILEAYGSKVVLADHSIGNDCHVRKTKDITNEHPEYIWLDQLTNQANSNAHYYGTGDEIVRDFFQNKMDIHAFVAGMGSGGTLMGIGSKIKKTYKESSNYLVQPKGYDLFSERYIHHEIQGWGIGSIPPIFKREVVDFVIEVSYEEAISKQKQMVREEGLLIGISSGANIVAAQNVARELGRGKNVVTIAPDSGISYLDVFLKN